MTQPTFTLARQFLLGALLALPLLSTSSAHADTQTPPTAAQLPAMPPPGMHGGPGMQEHGMGSPDMGPQTGMANNLNLNDKQRELYKAAMGLKMQSMQGAMSLHEELREVTQSDNYSEKKVRELITKHQKESEEKIVKSSNAMHEFYASLSPEQKAKLNEMHKKRKEQMKDRVKDAHHDSQKPDDGKHKPQTETH